MRPLRNHERKAVSCAFRRSQASARSSSDTGGGEAPARGPWPGAKDPLAPPLRGRGGGSSAPRKRSRARRAARAHHQPPPMVRTTAAEPRPLGRRTFKKSCFLGLGFCFCFVFCWKHSSRPKQTSIY